MRIFHDPRQFELAQPKTDAGLEGRLSTSLPSRNCVAGQGPIDVEQFQKRDAVAVDRDFIAIVEIAIGFQAEAVLADIGQNDTDAETETRDVVKN
jgi:hypothetical protein